MLDPQNSSVDEMVANLSDEQQEMFLHCLKEVSKHLTDTGRMQDYHDLVDKLAQDESMLNALSTMLEKYKERKPSLGGRMMGSSYGQGF